ncbi:hypothetical protein GF406_20540 [candidate division KSB1 bacterium]|nr:hypothetical protein [candidate division KSB1 bacterium]
MDEIAFTTQDFNDLEFIDNFNKEHWTAGPSSIGWNYDIEKTDPRINDIRQSLQRIKSKLSAIGEYMHSKDEYKDLEFGVQKITDGRTVRYLSELWMYFYKGLEKKSPNEPQLQLAISKENIHISVWFENKSANEKYLKNFLEDYSDELKQDSQIQIMLYESGIGGKLIDTYKTYELEKFAAKLSELNFDCKLGFQYIYPKEEVIRQGDQIVSTIEKYMDKMKQYFDKASNTGKQFTAKNISINEPTPPNPRQDSFNLLLNKKEIILYGPPGTGKTYKTKDIAVEFLSDK